MINRPIVKYGKEHKLVYAENARELRSMLPEEMQHTLLPQIGSAVAICTTNTDDPLQFFCDDVNRAGFYLPTSYPERCNYYREVDFRILVSHRTDNELFSLIGGAKKPCESLEETAFRELGEESGLEVDDLLPLGVVSGGDEMINVYPDGNAAEGIDALYLAMVPRGTITRPNSETREFIWMTPDEINAAVTIGRWHPAQVKTVKTLLMKLIRLPEIYGLHLNNYWFW